MKKQIQMKKEKNEKIELETQPKDKKAKRIQMKKKRFQNWRLNN